MSVGGVLIAPAPPAPLRLPQVPADLLCAAASVSADMTAEDEAAARAPSPASHTLRAGLCTRKAGGGGGGGGLWLDPGEAAVDALLRRLWEARPSSPLLPVRLAAHVPAALEVRGAASSDDGGVHARTRPPPARRSTLRAARTRRRCCACYCSGARASPRRGRGTLWQRCPPRACPPGPRSSRRDRRAPPRPRAPCSCRPQRGPARWRPSSR